jgi:PIN domain nuclease of toxin-antitoxin system
LRNALRVGEGIAISDISLWEVAMISPLPSFNLTRPLDEYLRYLAGTFIVLPITPAIALRSVAFSPSYPKDPADRIVGATALEHGLTLVSSDRKIRKSGEVPCIW